MDINRCVGAVHGNAIDGVVHDLAPVVRRAPDLDGCRKMEPVAGDGYQGGRRGAFAFLRAFFAGRRDDGAAAGAGASREASVGGAGAAAPDKVWFSEPKTSLIRCSCESAPDLPALIREDDASGAMSAKSLVSLASHFPALPRRVLPHASMRGP